MEKSKINNIVFEDIDHSDYPDFCDAFIASADINERPMTSDELEEINNDRDFVHEKLMDHLN